MGNQSHLPRLVRWLLGGCGDRTAPPRASRPISPTSPTRASARANLLRLTLLRVVRLTLLRVVRLTLLRVVRRVVRRLSLRRSLWLCAPPHPRSGASHTMRNPPRMRDSADSRRRELHSSRVPCACAACVACVRGVRVRALTASRAPAHAPRPPCPRAHPHAHSSPHCDRRAKVTTRAAARQSRLPPSTPPCTPLWGSTNSTLRGDQGGSRGARGHRPSVAAPARDCRGCACARRRVRSWRLLPLLLRLRRLLRLLLRLRLRRLRRLRRRRPPQRAMRTIVQTRRRAATGAAPPTRTAAAPHQRCLRPMQTRVVASVSARGGRCDRE